MQQRLVSGKHRHAKEVLIDPLPNNTFALQALAWQLIFWDLGFHLHGLALQCREALLALEREPLPILCGTLPKPHGLRHSRHSSR